MHMYSNNVLWETYGPQRDGIKKHIYYIMKQVHNLHSPQLFEKPSERGHDELTGNWKMEMRISTLHFGRIFLKIGQLTKEKKLFLQMDGCYEESGLN